MCSGAALLTDDSFFDLIPARYQLSILKYLALIKSTSTLVATTLRQFNTSGESSFASGRIVCFDFLSSYEIKMLYIKSTGAIAILCIVD